jgi:hypothetical protein
MLKAVSGITRAQAAALLGLDLPAGPAFEWTTPLATIAAPPAADVLYLYTLPLAQARTLAAIHMRVVAAGTGSAVKWGLWRVVNRRPFGLPVVSQNAGIPTTTPNSFITQASINVLLESGRVAFGTVHTGTLPTMTSAFPGVNGNTTVFTSLLGALGVPAGAYSIAQPYPNNIAALDLTGAALAPHTGATPAALLEYS